MDIVLRDISKSFGEKQIFSHFSCSVPCGSAAAIMAPSGGGKTTLLRLLLGLEKPDGGEITGVPQRCSAVFQEDRLCPNLSVEANIRMVTGRSVPDASVLEVLTRLGLERDAKTPAAELSGGMARRAALARALLYPSELLVLDEPFNGLDEENRRTAAEVIGDYRAGRTLLLVTHREDDLPLLGIEKTIRL